MQNSAHESPGVRREQPGLQGQMRTPRSGKRGWLLQEKVSWGFWPARSGAEGASVWRPGTGEAWRCKELGTGEQWETAGVSQPKVTPWTRAVLLGRCSHWTLVEEGVHKIMPTARAYCDGTESIYSVEIGGTYYRSKCYQRFGVVAWI